MLVLIIFLRTQIMSEDNHMKKSNKHFYVFKTEATRKQYMHFKGNKENDAVVAMCFCNICKVH